MNDLTVQGESVRHAGKKTAPSCSPLHHNTIFHIELYISRPLQHDLKAFCTAFCTVPYHVGVKLGVYTWIIFATLNHIIL